VTHGRVMAGLVPAIHAALPRNGKRLEFRVYSASLIARRGVDARDKRPHDGCGFTALGVPGDAAFRQRHEKKRRA